MQIKNLTPEQQQKIQAIIQKPNPNQLAEKILKQNKILTFQDTNEIFQYNTNTGIYEPAETNLMTHIQQTTQWKTSTHFVNEVLNSIRRQTYHNREEINENTNLIPLQDVIYDFQNGQFLPYTPEKIFFTKHPIKIPEHAEDWKNRENPINDFINEIVPRQEDEVFLKEIAGYCFYRKMPFQNFFLLVGAGANGKSVFLNILRSMIGKQNVSNESLQNLTENRFAAANLYLKNANIFGDLSSKALHDTGVLKQITGNDVITAERKFKPSFQFRSYAKIVASCNEVPEAPDQTDAFYRRPLLVNFPYCFEGRENRTLFEELDTDYNRTSFFFSCINAFKDVLGENRFIRRDSISDKKEMYLNYSNSSYAFLNSALDYDPESELKTDDIYNSYKVFCKEKNLVCKDERQFFQKLYKFFGHKVYKSRRTEDLKRFFVVVGVNWVLAEENDVQSTTQTT